MNKQTEFIYILYLYIKTLIFVFWGSKNSTSFLPRNAKKNTSEFESKGRRKLKNEKKEKEERKEIREKSNSWNSRIKRRRSKVRMQKDSVCVYTDYMNESKYAIIYPQ